MKTEETKKWAKSIANNEQNASDNTKAQILEACKELGLDSSDADRRFQHAGAADLSKKEGVFFILTGSPYPSKQGYSWA